MIVFIPSLPEVWAPFIGDERKRIPRSPRQRGGGVRFAKHLGRPLTQQLWEDLYERLMCVAFNVYGPGFDEQKTIGYLVGPYAWIYLDEHYLVRDIEFNP